jgi:hypothetical protein
LVLLATANAKYEFIYGDVGINGRISDGGVIENTTLYEKLSGGHTQLPPRRKPQNGIAELLCTKTS